MAAVCEREEQWEEEREMGRGRTFSELAEPEVWEPGPVVAEGGDGGEGEGPGPGEEGEV